MDIIQEFTFEAAHHLPRVAPDLVITDLNMPRLDGFGVIEAIRARDDFAGLPILVLTTESAPALRDRARSSGATGWIVKPFNPEQLLATLKRVLPA